VTGLSAGVIGGLAGGIIGGFIVLSAVIYTLFLAHRRRVATSPVESPQIRSDKVEEPSPVGGRLQDPLETPGARLGARQEITE
jgi:hypothetical protein